MALARALYATALVQEGRGAGSNLHYSMLGFPAALAVAHIFFLQRQGKEPDMSFQFCSSLLASLSALGCSGRRRSRCADSLSPLGRGRLLPASSHLGVN